MHACITGTCGQIVFFWFRYGYIRRGSRLLNLRVLARSEAHTWMRNGNYTTPLRGIFHACGFRPPTRFTLSGLRVGLDENPISFRKSFKKKRSKWFQLIQFKIFNLHGNANNSCMHVLYRTMGSVQSKTIFDNLRASVLHGVVQNHGQCTVQNNFW